MKALGDALAPLALPRRRQPAARHAGRPPSRLRDRARRRRRQTQRRFRRQGRRGAGADVRRSHRHARPPARSPWRLATTRSFSTPRSPRATCACASARACASASSARWKRACKRSTAWCWAGSTKQAGRRTCAATPGCRARCGLRSASICRSGASALPRTTSRRRSAPRRSCSRARPRARARPTVASRFLQRMAALAGAERWAAARRRGEFYLALAEALDAPSGKPQPVKRPEPSPPLEARPDKLSVTDIENWLRDPYTIYAKHVLDLHPLEAVATPPGAADRGSVIHEAIGNFTRQFAAGLPRRSGAGTDCAWPAKLRASGRLSRRRKAFWWPRFLRIARWFAGWERERRPQLATVHGEIRGELKIPLGAQGFHAVGTRRPHRAPRRRRLRHPRLQDRRAADRAAGAHGIGAAAHARSRHPARRRLRR